MKLVHIKKGQRREFRKLIAEIADLLLHFTMDELKMVHDFVKEWKNEDE